jgi:hypothetical protein
MQIPALMARAATADVGSSLDKELRGLMEYCFGTDLGHIRTHRMESSAATLRTGALAFTVDHHVCLCPGFEAIPDAIRHYILAHELTHVMQKELGRDCQASSARSGIIADLEREADEIAFQVLLGKRVQPVTPDRSPDARCWGPAGHYYTVFFAAMMAGLSLDDCKTNAFYAQMPDQVTELDAIPAGKGWGLRLFHAPTNWNADQMVIDAQVQLGLHALTGWSADAETAYRNKILDKLDPGSFEFGLALHPFGDSYAHRVLDGGGRMYKAPVGHLVEADLQDATPHDWLRGAHRPDRIELRPKLYREYGLALYDMFIKRWQISMDEDTKRDRRQRFGAYLDVISSQTGEDSQIDKMGEMKGFDSDLDLATLNFYFPQMEDEVGWEQFRLRTRVNGQVLRQDLLDRALGCAEDWSRAITFFH